MAIDDITEPADGIFVWGTAPQVYLAADRRSVGRFSYLYPLVTPGFTTRSMILQVVDDLIADPPALIIDAGSGAPGSPGFQPLLQDRPLATDGRDLDILDPIREFVRASYEADGLIDGWPIYQRTSRPVD